MIENERQYRLTQAQAVKFEATLRRLQSAPPNPNLHPDLQQAEIDGVKSILEELREEIAAYEQLRNNGAAAIEAESLAELPRALIQARIAAGLTQRELAERLGLKEQQIQRYESTGYASASLTRLIEIAEALGLQLRLHGELSLASR